MVAEKEEDGVAPDHHIPQYQQQKAARRGGSRASGNGVGGSLEDFNQMIRNLEDDDMQHQIHQILEENRLALGGQKA